MSCWYNTCLYYLGLAYISLLALPPQYQTIIPPDSHFRVLRALVFGRPFDDKPSYRARAVVRLSCFALVPTFLSVFTAYAESSPLLPRPQVCPTLARDYLGSLVLSFSLPPFPVSPSRVPELSGSWPASLFLFFQLKLLLSYTSFAPFKKFVLLYTIRAISREGRRRDRKRGRDADVALSNSIDVLRVFINPPQRRRRREGAAWIPP